MLLFFSNLVTIFKNLVTKFRTQTLKSYLENNKRNVADLYEYYSEKLSEIYISEYKQACRKNIEEGHYGKAAAKSNKELFEGF